MALTDTTLRNAKPKAKPYKLADVKGLLILVQPSGGKLWRWKYRISGRDEDGNPKRIERKLGLGTYPEAGLKEARDLGATRAASWPRGSIQQRRNVATVMPRS